MHPEESQRLGALVAEGAARLREAGVPRPRGDALLLAADATGRTVAFVLAHPEHRAEAAETEAFASCLQRRLHREPLQYIRGFQEFWGLKVRVGPGTLVPRPETEHLVEEALACLGGISRPLVAEAGVGSGCVLLALAAERPGGFFLGLDREGPALAWARKNLSGRPHLLLARGDLDASAPLRNLDVLVSNPPYITDGEWEDLPPEVRIYEPQSALRCGTSPLGPYRRLAAWAHACLKPGGHLVAELGLAQAKRAGAMRKLHPGLAWVRGRRDYSGRLRVAVWQKLMGCPMP